MKETSLAPLRDFFALRASCIRKYARNPRVLYFASGEDPRLLNEPHFLDDLYGSIVRQLDITSAHSLLEIGCACGFVSRGVAPHCKEYTGVDLVETSLKTARALNIPNAVFCQANAMALPFAEAGFDRVLCYNVLHNLPQAEMITEILREALRVLRPGGRLLVGFVPDADRHEALRQALARDAKMLNEKYGPMRNCLPMVLKCILILEKIHRKIKPGHIQFNPLPKEIFSTALQRADTEVYFDDIHNKHPQHGLRFNVICLKKELPNHE